MLHLRTALRGNRLQTATVRACGQVLICENRKTCVSYPAAESDYMRSLLSAGEYSAPRCNRGRVLTNLTFFTDPIDP